MKRNQVVYLIPNLLTSLTVAAGFYALTASASGHFEAATHAVLFALISDGLDGRVARMLDSQSAFGAEYDSLADMIAFGLAPAMLAFSHQLHHWGSLGWSCCFLYAAATALRLARFNVQAQEQKHFFKGIPCPSAAVLVAGGDACLQGLSAGWHRSLLGLLVVGTALLMVSQVPYPSFKSVQWQAKYTPLAALVIALAIGLVSVAPVAMVTLTVGLYLASGLVLAGVQWWKGRSLLRSVAHKSHELTS